MSSMKIFTLTGQHQSRPNLHCFPKQSCDHVFDDKLNYCPFTTIFGKLIIKSIGHRQVFLFSRFIYTVVQKNAPTLADYNYN